MSKVFHTGSVYEETFFTKDVQALEAAGPIVRAFNALGVAAPGYLNKSEVWQDVEPDSMGKKERSIVEPFLEGSFLKYNSNSGFAENRYEAMQALSHYSYHYSYHATGGAKLSCDLQGVFNGETRTLYMCRTDGLHVQNV